MRYFIALLMLAIAGRTSAQPAWTKLASPSSLASDYAFSSAMDGWAAGDYSTLFQTIDGGDTWIPRDVVHCQGCYTNYGVNFYEGGGVLFTNTFGSLSSQTLFMTTDGGAHWDSTLTTDTVYDPAYGTEWTGVGYIQLETNHLFSASRLVTKAGPLIIKLFKTSDRGRHWSFIAEDSYNHYEEFRSWSQPGWPRFHSFTEANLTFIGWTREEYQRPRVTKFTTDGGSTWSSQEFGPDTLIALDNHVWLARFGDTLMRSSDDMKTWTTISTEFPAGAVKRVDANTAFYLFTDTLHSRIGSIAITRDAGLTWDYQQLAPNLHPLFDPIQMFGRDTVYVFTREGIFRTFTGGMPGSGVMTRDRSGVSFTFTSSAIEVDLTSLPPGASLQIFDALGREVYSHSANPTLASLTIEKSQLPRGVLFLRAGDRIAKIVN